MNYDIYLQIAIVLFSGSAIWLVGCKNQKLKRWGFLIGVIGQPLWMITTYYAKQWGIFALSIFYLFSWANGLRNHWKT